MSDAINTTMLAPSTVRLIGREIGGLVQGKATGSLIATPLAGKDDALPNYQGRSILLQTLSDKDLKLAYIFAFSHEGRYTTLQSPALFVVHGSGALVREDEKPIDPARLGLASLDGTITFASDLKFWAYDRSDQTLRLDMSSGTLQQLVIDAESGSGHGHRIDLIGQESSFSARLGQGSY